MGVSELFGMTVWPLYDSMVLSSSNTEELWYFYFQVIDFDQSPTKVHYIDSLDQVWIICSNNVTQTKTTVIIRQASIETPHSILHSTPKNQHYDQVSKCLFFQLRYLTMCNSMPPLSTLRLIYCRPVLVVLKATKPIYYDTFSL